MIGYKDLETSSVFTEKQLRELFPNVSFPSPFVPPDGYEVVELPEAEKTPDQLRMEAKIRREQAVLNIVVTTSSGKQFDGDEQSQNRMTRAVIGMQYANAPSIPWTLADNTEVVVTLEELAEALVLAGTQQTQLWPLSVET